MGWRVYSGPAASCVSPRNVAHDGLHLLLGRIGRHGDVIVFVDPQHFLHCPAGLRIGIQQAFAIPPVLIPEHGIRQTRNQHAPFVDFFGCGVEKFVDPLFLARGQHQLSPCRRFTLFGRLVDLHLHHHHDRLVDGPHRCLPDRRQPGHGLILLQQGAAHLGQDGQLLIGLELVEGRGTELRSIPRYHRGPCPRAWPGPP